MILGIIMICFWQTAYANSKIMSVTFNKGSGQLNQANVIETVKTKSEMECGAQCLKKSGCKSFAVSGSTCVLFSDDSGVLQIPGGPFGYSCFSTTWCASGLVCRNSRCRCLEYQYRDHDLAACKPLTELVITGVNGDKNETYFEIYWNPPTNEKFVDSYIIRRDAAPDITVWQPHVTVSELLPSTSYAITVTPIVIELDETKYGPNHTIDWRTACSSGVYSQYTLDGIQHSLRYVCATKICTDAHASCAEVGAHLIRITSRQMLDDLAVLLGIWGHGTGRLCIDGVMPWAEWSTGNPGGEACLYIAYYGSVYGYQMYDYYCTTYFKYVCEM